MKIFLNFKANIEIIIDALLSILDGTLDLLKSIFSFTPGFRKEQDKKVWIKFSEFSKYVSILAWITQTKELKPYYNAFMKAVTVIINKSSSTWAFAYYKEVMRLTVRALAGSPEIVSIDTKIRVARDKVYGLPKAIPFALRKEMIAYINHNNDPVADTTYTQLTSNWGLTDYAVSQYVAMSEIKPIFNQKAIVGIMTLLSVFRVLRTKVEVDYSSIILPFDGFIKTIPYELLHKALTRIFPNGSKINVGKFKPFISRNAGPNGALATWSAGIDALAFIHNPSSGLAVARWMYSQRAYFYLVWFVVLILLFGPIYLLLYSLKYWPGIFLRSYMSGKPFRFERDSIIVKILDPIYYGLAFIAGRLRIATGRFRGETGSLNIGKLGVVYDQAGKARVVAATNWWIQSCLSGLHESIFDHLKSLKTDGTFDQDGCFDRFISAVKPGTTMSGFDLSAATDRLPIDLQVDVLNALGLNGYLWRQMLDISWKTQSEDLRYIKYSVGQPMGALSSWAMLALTHHVIVNVAAIHTDDRLDFKDVNYAVLGDDFVISHDAVAESYRNIMAALGLEIKLAKSVISTRFTEFAKKLKGPNVNFTPIGPGAILSACRSGYMIPAVFMSAIGSVITNPQEVLDLVDKVPSGIVARRDLGKFTALVLWQMFNAKGTMTNYVNRLGRDTLSLLNLNTNIFLSTSSPVYIHIFDSMTNLYTKEMRAQISASHAPMVSFLNGVLPILVSEGISLRVLETLIKPFNPGFWAYLKDAFIAPILLEEAWINTFKTMPNGGPSVWDSYSNYWLCISHMQSKERRASILELKFTKSESKATARYYQDLMNDMTKRFERSNKYPLNTRWYELEGSGLKNW
jgi:hypothetical protein